jgi:hypothetical protein
MTDTMTEQRFASLAESCGADLSRWPRAEQAAARDLLRTSVAARDALAAQHALDGWLEAVAAPALPSPALRERILAEAPQPVRHNTAIGWLVAMWGELGGSRRAGPVFAASLALGIALAPLAAPLDPQWVDIAVDDIDWSDEDYEELVP